MKKMRGECEKRVNEGECDECVKWIREVGLGLYSVPNGLKGIPDWV